LEQEDANDDQRRLIDSLKRDDGEVFNVMRTFARSPKLLNSWMGLATHIMGTSSISPRHREILILRVGWLTGSEYEWGQHLLMSLPAGLDEKDHRRIAEGAEADGWDAFEAQLVRAADELHRDSMIGDETWTALAKEYSEEQILDAIFTVGNYAMLALALNSVGVQREKGIPGFADCPGHRPSDC